MQLSGYLKELLCIGDEDILYPDEATPEDLKLVHTKRYLNSLKWGWNVAAIAEIPLLVFLPNTLIQRCYLRPMRYQTRGSVLAGQLAVKRGWAINLGGGFHHCSRDQGGGFCPYADITLLVENLFKSTDNIKRIMIVDLDAHQGNGYARDFEGNQDIFIMDVYNKGIYPHDIEAKKAIRCKVELQFYTEDDEYLDKVETNLEQSLSQFHPDLLVYNAGTDILSGDSLGRLSITPKVNFLFTAYCYGSGKKEKEKGKREKSEKGGLNRWFATQRLWNAGSILAGVIRRDELVFMKARERRVPIVMLTSGGYCRESAQVIAESIGNLYHTGLIDHT
ncbi:histone deacetylase 11 isoform X2 [Rhodnius prolixus]|uniref:histone deacetylase 11 isoform X2 n=1 Tax=Rhodnius prolixus TaxID=13249 RepID=UPI003D188E77